MGNTNVLVKAQSMWFQDRGSSWRLPTNTLNVSYKTKVAQYKICTHIIFLEEKFNVVHAKFLLEFQRGLEIDVAHINSHCED
jgi:hypothetical protein